MRGMDVQDEHPDAEFIVYDDTEYSDSESAHGHRDSGEVHGVVPEALKRADLNLYPDIPDWIVTPDEWGSAFPTRYSVLYRERMAMPVTKLMVHHSASSQPSPAAEFAFQRNLERYGEARDGAACEYHYIIYPTGTVCGGFMDTRGCHSAQVDPSYPTRTLYNKSAIGICFIGNFYGTGLVPTDAALASFRRLINWLVESGRADGVVFERRDTNGSRGFYRHRDVFATVCPADVETGFRQMFVRDAQPTPPAPQPVPDPQPQPQPQPQPGPVPDPTGDFMFYIVRVQGSPHIFIGLGAKAPGGQLIIPNVTWLPDSSMVDAYKNTQTPEFLMTYGKNTVANFVPDNSLDDFFGFVQSHPA